MSPRLALHFLGTPHIQLDNESITLERRKALALLAYLAIEQGSHSRESLTALLWPDYAQSKAFKNLRQVLYEIQKTISEGWLLTRRDKISLNDDVAAPAGTGEVWLDVREFETRFAEGCAQNDIGLRISLLADTAKLYRNHFLTGFSLKDAHPFNDWAFAESEALRHTFCDLLSKLSDDYCATGQAAQAIPHARRLVGIDPLNETAHRQLMESYLQAGQSNAALKQYQALEQILRKELNLDPQPETRELYKRIRRGEAKPVRVEKRTELIAPQHNLPHQLTMFIGREKEQHQVISLIAKKRLVTLVGAGGIGKTSLSLQVGRKLLQEYPDGVWFIALDSLGDPALLTQTVASVFNIREGVDRRLLEKLTDFLRPKTTLLILDNCEHLLDACAQLITALLTSCPNFKVLTTSREALGIPGEAIYTIPSLPLPEQDEDALETMSEFESIQLFAERAALSLTSFELTKENIRAVVDVCRRVDGIPLAIELAAARVNILSVEEILAQLQDSFALLASDTRTILPRHQTLRGSMEWSWDLLSEAEQRFLRQLSVFAGGWTLESAQAVFEDDVLELSSALVKKSLIVVDQETGRETRYRFHEMVREFAHDRLVRSGHEEKIRTLHLKYFVNLSGQAKLERLNEESNNLRAALHWAYRTDIEAGLYLSGQLRRYWESANVREGIYWLENFINNPRSVDFPAARAQALHTYGWLMTWFQQFERARIAAEESLALFRAAGDQRGEADTLVSLANIWQFLDDPDSASELLHKSLDLARSLNDPWREANVYYFLGWHRRDSRRTVMYWEKAVSLYRQTEDQIALANLLSLLGQFRILEGDIEIGEGLLDEAIVLWEANNRANIWENVKIAQSVLALLEEENEKAYELLEQALQSAKERGNRMSYLWVRVRMGYAALLAGRLEEAYSIFAETAQDFKKDGYTIGTAVALEGIAIFYVITGKPERAARLIGWADAIRKKFGDPRRGIEQADVDKIISACIASMGDVTFSEAYDEGQKMSLDEAVAYALGEN